MRNGRGTLTFGNGDSIESDWKLDKMMSGYGKIISKDKGMYSGEIQNSLKHGSGEILYENGTKFEGN